MEKNKNSKTIVFLCNARDFHAIDWYRIALKTLPNREIVILTDLIQGEGYKRLINKKDKIFKLLIIDKILFNTQSSAGNIWRNFIKLILFPIQVFLIKRFSKKFPNSIYHAHSMYYLVLAWAARVKYVGTPQGSDILVKPYNSRIYKYFTIKAVRRAKAVTVDSQNMFKNIKKLCNIEPKIIQNGIDLESILKMNDSLNIGQIKRENILSIRGIAPIYRIIDIVQARNASKNYKTPITLTSPFAENDYKNDILKIIQPFDQFLGRVDKFFLYELLFKAKLVFSIPLSDSSPKSVYESIFLGCAVAISPNEYYETLPNCMKSRIILIDFEDKKWFDSAIVSANKIIKTPFVPSEEALKVFDQRESLKAIAKLFDD
jgi:hypothetical protein